MAVIRERITALIAEQNDSGLTKHAGEYFCMQQLGQLAVTAAGQFRKQRMRISFLLQKITDTVFPALVWRGEGRAVFTMFTQVQIIRQIFF